MQVKDEGGEIVLHEKRGTQYQVLGIGELQCDTLLAEGDRLVVYRSLDDGKLWVRPAEEFEDGRFVALADLGKNRAEIESEWKDALDCREVLQG